MPHQLVNEITTKVVEIVVSTSAKQVSIEFELHLGRNAVVLGGKMTCEVDVSKRDDSRPLLPRPIHGSSDSVLVEVLRWPGVEVVEPINIHEFFRIYRAQVGSEFENRTNAASTVPFQNNDYTTVFKK